MVCLWITLSIVKTSLICPSNIIYVKSQTYFVVVVEFAMLILKSHCNARGIEESGDIGKEDETWKIHTFQFQTL